MDRSRPAWRVYMCHEHKRGEGSERTCLGVRARLDHSRDVRRGARVAAAKERVVRDVGRRHLAGDRRVSAVAREVRAVAAARGRGLLRAAARDRNDHANGNADHDEHADDDERLARHGVLLVLLLQSAGEAAAAAASERERRLRRGRMGNGAQRKVRRRWCAPRVRLSLEP